jgi:ubiquinone/menaquinone biosynthesis C-methylase UbiE
MKPADALHEQYRDSSNFRKRATLVERFSTTRYSWYRWVFEQVRLGPGSRILELGCGPGSLWTRNVDKLGPGNCVVLSDFSAGMLRDCRAHLGGKSSRVSFCQLNAAVLPFRARSFDAVIANMMFYHVDDRPAALIDIRRVLTSNGVFYATTLGRESTRELHQSAFRVLGVSRRTGSEQFGLENGYELLASVFRHVETRRFANSLRITEVEPLNDYFRSMTPLISAPAERWTALSDYFQQMIRERGEIFVPFDLGMLLAHD